MATFFESGTWVWIPDEEEVVLPAKARSAFRLGERATVVLENGAVGTLICMICTICVVCVICAMCVISCDLFYLFDFCVLYDLFV